MGMVCNAECAVDFRRDDQLEVNPKDVPSCYSVMGSFGKTVTGVKNMWAKPISQIHEYCKKIYWGDRQGPYQWFNTLNADAAGFKAFAAIWDIRAKAEWIPTGESLQEKWDSLLNKGVVETVSQTWNQLFLTEAGRKVVGGVADWTMSVVDAAEYVNKVAIPYISGRITSAALKQCFNIASLTFSAVCLKEEYDRYNYAIATGKLHRLGEKDRPMQEADYIAMALSVTISVAYAAATIFGANFAVRWSSLAIATGAIVANHFWREIYVKPLDKAYDRALQVKLA